MHEGSGQEARPRELHLQRLHLEKSGLSGDSRLELEGGLEGVLRSQSPELPECSPP